MRGGVCIVLYGLDIGYRLFWEGMCFWVRWFFLVKSNFWRRLIFEGFGLVVLLVVGGISFLFLKVVYYNVLYDFICIVY